MKDHSNKTIKRVATIAGGLVIAFTLTSCNQNLCTVQDKANQLYAYYGDLYTDGVDNTGTDAEHFNQTVQIKNRQAFYSSVENNYGYSRPTKEFQAFMSNKVTEFVAEKFTIWTARGISEAESKIIAKSVAIYAGLDDTGNVSTLWGNLDSWYNLALLDPTVGVNKAPAEGYIAALKSTAESLLRNNKACLTPDGQTFTQNGSDIYMEGLTWGQAFKKFGFFQGLLTYPFGYIVHAISSHYNYAAWALVLAIFVVTILARSFTVFTTVLQARTQAKQQKIQPQIAELQKMYPNNQTDREERQQFAMAQSKLMRENKVHPFLPMLLMIVQFPIFICVWAALQSSAALATGSFFGLSLTTPVSTCFTQYKSTPGALAGIFIFIFMTIANFLSSGTGMWFNNWRTKKFGMAPVPNQNGTDPGKTMKIFSYVMMAFIIIMGWSLPVGMGVYWIFGALISIIQSLITELLHRRNRRKSGNNGDGSDLASIRRSAHHKDGPKKVVKAKTVKKEKPLWR